MKAKVGLGVLTTPTGNRLRRKRGHMETTDNHPARGKSLLPHDSQAAAPPTLLAPNSGVSLMHLDHHLRERGNIMGFA